MDKTFSIYAESNYPGEVQSLLQLNPLLSDFNYFGVLPQIFNSTAFSSAELWINRFQVVSAGNCLEIAFYLYMNISRF